MNKDLSQKEKTVLNIYINKHNDADYPFQQELNKFDPNNEISISLYEKGYINITVSKGLQGYCEIQICYQVNGSVLTDYTLEAIKINPKAFCIH